MKQNADKLKKPFLESLPRVFSPKIAAERLPGVVNEKTLANLRSLGQGPAYIKQQKKRKVLYVREPFVDWLIESAHYVEPIS